MWEEAFPLIEGIAEHIKYNSVSANNMVRLIKNKHVRKDSYMKKLTVFLMGTSCFLGGVLLGILMSPVKQGIGNNSGNTYNNHYNQEEAETEE